MKNIRIVLFVLLAGVVFTSCSQKRYAYLKKVKVNNDMQVANHRVSNHSTIASHLPSTEMNAAPVTVLPAKTNKQVIKKEVKISQQPQPSSTVGTAYHAKKIPGSYKAMKTLVKDMTGRKSIADAVYEFAGLRWVVGGLILMLIGWLIQVLWFPELGYIIIVVGGVIFLIGLIVFIIDLLL
jgi:hypothetical protein